MGEQSLESYLVICGCVPGFTNNWPNGCTRKSTLDCDYTNKFVSISGINLPDPTTVGFRIGLNFSTCTTFTLIDYQCMIWLANLSDISVYSSTGQNLYVRVSGDYKDSPNMSNTLSKEYKETDGENELELPLVDFEIIAAATDNFSPENKLGEGGFGPVYKGRKEMHFWIGRLDIVLLWEDLKASDFGMARIFGDDETDFNTRKIVGTFGYMSPEYVLEGIFSMKSDIYSFGVLILEIISGKKNRGVYAVSTHLSLLAHVWDLWKESESLQLVDEKIVNNAPVNEIVKCIKIGLLCVQERPENRPLMPSIIEMFSRDITLLPEPNPPGFVTRFAPPDTINVQEQFSLNNVLITSLGGR